MGKWNVLVVMIMMVTTVMVVTVESDNATDWMRCFRSCSVPCEDHNGNCFECCKIKCGGPNPPHGPGGPPAHSFRRYKSFYSFHLHFLMYVLLFRTVNSKLIYGLFAQTEIHMGWHMWTFAKRKNDKGCLWTNSDHFLFMM